MSKSQAEVKKQAKALGYSLEKDGKRWRLVGSDGSIVAGHGEGLTLAEVGGILAEVAE